MYYPDIYSGKSEYLGLFKQLPKDLVDIPLIHLCIILIKETIKYLLSK